MYISQVIIPGQILSFLNIVSNDCRHLSCLVTVIVYKYSLIVHECTTSNTGVPRANPKKQKKSDRLNYTCMKTALVSYKCGRSTMRLLSSASN